jgi:hypothetical protein
MATVYTAINRQGVVFLWPVRLPEKDGRILEWTAEMAMEKWLRVVPNTALSAYEIFVAPSVIPDPVWPGLPFQELLRIGFRDRLIDSVIHPVVKRLRGLA